MLRTLTVIALLMLCAGCRQPEPPPSEQPPEPQARATQVDE